MAQHLIPSAATLKAIKPGDTRRRLSDGAGLHLLLFVNGGSHGWWLDSTFQGLRKTFGLGTYPATGLGAARQKAEEARRLLNAGTNPSDASTNKYRDLTQTISAGLSTLRASTPEVMKGFSELGRAATANGVLDAKTKELIALALSVATRCDPCIGFHTKALVTLGATRQELDETSGVTTYMGGGPSSMYAANAVTAFDEFVKASSARTA